MTRKPVAAALLILSVWSAVLGLDALGLAAGPAFADQKDSRLDSLFDQLKTSATPREAAILELSIWQIWSETEDDDAALLFRRGLEAMAAGDTEAALRRFTEVTKRAPDFAEGWNKRATVLFMMGDYDASVADVEQTLALEPRHFGALSGLGLINMALGRDAAAVKAFEAALAIHPHLPGAQKFVKELKAKLAGKPT